jgi:N-acyl-D-amino-acid deacylase
MRITADQYPYTASSTSLAATVIPSWARAGSRQEWLARIDDPEQGPRIRRALEDKLEILDGGQRIQIASFAPRPEWAGMRLSEIAAREHKSPLEMVLEIERAGGAAIVNHSINEEDVRVVMQRPWVATASDGGAKLPSATVPHPRNYGTFPRKLGYYSIQEDVIPLAQAVRSSTGLPADILGLSDRGYLRPEMKADIAVWDPKTFIDRATFEKPHQYSVGLRYLLTNGVFVVSEGVPTGALAGRPLVRDVGD